MVAKDIVGKGNSSGVQKAGSDRSIRWSERAAGLQFSPFLRRIVPTSARDVLRQARSWILSRYLMRQLPRDKTFEQSEEDALASKSVSIIVPVHDAPEVTRRCLMSLQKYAPQAEVVLVDDASRFEETNGLLGEFSHRNNWKLVRHKIPLGHSAACAAGAALATRPYLCLLNSDTVVTPWCWQPVTQTFDDNPEIGVAGPSTSHAGTSQALPLANYTRHYLNDSQICEYASRLSVARNENVLIDIPWVSGFALFIRRKIWEDVGGFDLSIPDYGNDVELCVRTQAKAYRVVWVRNSYIHHLANASYGNKIGAKQILARIRAAEDDLKRRYGHVRRDV